MLYRKRAKQVNPRRIQTARSEYDKNQGALQAGATGLHYAWLLILTVLLEQECLNETDAVAVWNAVHDSRTSSKLRGEQMESAMARANHLWDENAIQQRILPEDTMQ